jgi:hypothetical protein
MPQTRLSEESRAYKLDLQKHTQISITKLRDKKKLYLNLSTRATSFKVKQSFTLMMPVPSTLPFLSSPKVTYSLCDRGARLQNHFLFPVMCHEQPESMSHMSSKPPVHHLHRTRKVRWLSAEVSEINLRNPALNHATRRGFHSPLHLTTWSSGA